MNSIPLSKEQQSIASKLGTLHNFAYHDVTTALDSITHYALEELLSNHGFLLCAHNEIERLAFSSRMEDLGLGDIFLSIRSQDQVSNEDIIDLVSKLKKVLPSKPYRTDTLDYDYLFSKTYNNLQKFATPLLRGMDWYGLQELYLSSDHQEALLQLHSLIDTKAFRFDEEEFLEMKTLVAQGSYLYDISFDNSNPLSSRIMAPYDDAYLDKINEITYKLFGFIEEVSTLRDDYYAVLRDIEDDYINNVNIWKNDLLDQLHITKAKIASYQLNIPDKKRGFAKSIFSKGNPHLDQAKKEIIATLEDLLKEVNLASASRIIDQLLNEPNEEIWDTLKQAVDNKAEDKLVQLGLLIKSINRLNSKNDQLSALEDHLSDFLYRINNAGILTEKIEFNTLSFKKQVDFTANLVTQLENLILEIEKSTTYFQWMAFISGQHQSVTNVITALYSVKPTEWEKVFQTFYLYEWMRNISNKDLSINNDHFTSLYDAHDEKLKNTLGLILSNVEHSKTEAIANLKHSNLELYKALYKGGKWTSTMTWGELFNANSDFFVKVFPIVALDTDDLKYLKEGSYRTINYLNVKQHNVEVFHHFDTIHTYIPKHEVQGAFDGTVLHLPSLNGYLPIARWSLGERPAFASKICTHLGKYTDFLNVFHLKNMTILSYANQWCNQALVDYFYRQGIKSIDRTGINSKPDPSKMMDQLMNAFCDESREYLLLTQDFLLEKRHLEDFLYQKRLVDTLEYCGFKVININSQSLIAEPQSTINNVIDYINSLNNHVPSGSQKQIEFEIN